MLAAATSLMAASPVEAQQVTAEPLGPSVQAVSTGSPGSAPTTSSAASGPYLQRSRPECGDFKRSADGSWTAIQAVVLPAPAGPLKLDAGVSFRPGQMVGGADLGSILQRDCP
jgi:hypothetical protein